MKGHIVCGVWRREKLLESKYLANDEWGLGSGLGRRVRPPGTIRRGPRTTLLFSARVQTEGIEQRKKRVLKTLHPDTYERRKRRTMAALFREQRRLSVAGRLVVGRIRFFESLRVSGSIWACFALRHDVFPAGGVRSLGCSNLHSIEAATSLCMDTCRNGS